MQCFVEMGSPQATGTIEHKEVMVVVDYYLNVCPPYAHVKMRVCMHRNVCNCVYVQQDSWGRCLSSG